MFCEAIRSDKKNKALVGERELGLVVAETGAAVGEHWQISRSRVVGELRVRQFREGELPS